MTFVKRVLIIYRFLPQYRKPFYELLKERLADSGIDLALIYGDGAPEDRAKQDLVALPWAHFAPNRIYSLFGQQLYWQPVAHHAKGYDLVIVEQASKLLINYYLQFHQLLGVAKVALWGHGKNFQATANNKPGELIKKLVSRQAHWWFAYNERSKKIVEALGYPSSRITTVQNAIDTRQLKQYLEEIGESQKRNIRQRYGLLGRNLCVYCGGMYREKRLKFLLDAAIQIRRRVPDFELVLIGGGKERDLVEEAAARYPWIHYLGPLFEREKVEIFSIARLYLMPGLVGLGILDAFALGVPLVTTDIPWHSPEIDYLQPGINGVMTAPEVDSYAAAVAALLEDDAAYQALRANAFQDGSKYTIENMVTNFHDGILSALQLS